MKAALLAIGLLLIPASVSADCPVTSDLEVQDRRCVDDAIEPPPQAWACGSESSAAEWKACNAARRKGLRDAPPKIAQCMMIVEATYLAQVHANIRRYKFDSGVR